ncbi:BLUF domain-containing protein [Microlunatus spumicola]
MISYLAYASSATRELRADDIADILARSQRKNAAQDLTGALLYKGGSFLQVLEGPQQAVVDTFHRVGMDARHRGIVVLLRGVAPEREFGDWSMAYGDADIDGTCCGDYADFLTRRWAPDRDDAVATACRSLLWTFKRNLERA